MDDKARKDVVQAAVAVLASYLAAKAQVRVMRQSWAPPPASAAWHRIMRVCQRSAELLGRAGIYAERRYRETIE